jgi:hypothetical protein
MGRSGQSETEKILMTPGKIRKIRDENGVNGGLNTGEFSEKRRKSGRLSH